LEYCNRRARSPARKEENMSQQITDVVDGARHLTPDEIGQVCGAMWEYDARAIAEGWIFGYFANWLTGYEVGVSLVDWADGDWQNGYWVACLWVDEYENYYVNSFPTK
jgi:hypothetical protein